MISTTIQAPCVNLVATCTIGHDRGCGAEPVERGAAVSTRARARHPVHHHPRLRQREADEHADRVERDQRARFPRNSQTRSIATRASSDDPVGEREPVAARRELAGHVASSRGARQPRKVGERGVRREHEDREGRVLQREVERAAAEDMAAELREHRLRRGRHDVVVPAPARWCREEHGENRRHPAECRRRRSASSGA